MIKSKRRKKALLFIIACGLALSAPVWAAKFVSKGATAASQTAPDSGEGQAIFHQKCEVCHSIGGGDKVGPDLKGVTSLRSVDWLTRWISGPDKMLAAKDPVAVALQKTFIVPMPNLGLTKAETAAVIAYLKNPAGATAAPAAEGQAPAKAAQPQPAAPPAPAGAAKSAAPVGDAAAGELLFTGAQRFHNGGAPCMGCHSVAGIGALGGGTMGPDLTPAYGKYKEALLTWPNNMPPMQAIFSANPLTPQEQADLVAFLKSAVIPQRPTSAIWRLAVLAVIGAILLLIAAQFIWRRRLTSVRGSLVRKATKR
jgi:mono/diheme cytochrome c family protein